ncbi:E3 ubiquitin-protein ligase TRIM45-like [Saccostrea echinata]|uniref:E3 ubiquitin-protein ligase TRIM45-like n=1 Tax=Saccostrea echinata TaxID=191078 RepID=UPI002A827A7F|nr:E3 ubiquitin-protein ligase TRIM45-like [Saccostrea echinata]
MTPQDSTPLHSTQLFTPSLTGTQYKTKMAASDLKEYPLGSPLVLIKNCETHDLPIDITCEECDEFICAECAKTDHRDHDWKTLSTAATEKRKGLLTFLKKIKEDDLPRVDAKIEKISQQITENKQLCDSEIKKLQKHFDEIMAIMTDIKKCHEKTLKDNLVQKNDRLNHLKSELDKKRRIVETVEFMEENNSTMSDYSLLDNHRELTKMLSELKVHMTNCEHSVRFTRGEINDVLLESLVGKNYGFR